MFSAACIAEDRKPPKGSSLSSGVATISGAMGMNQAASRSQKEVAKPNQPIRLNQSGSPSKSK
jgi:hypothetical protein